MPDWAPLTLSHFSDYGFFKVELGYQVAVYFDAVNEYALSNVAGSPLAAEFIWRRSSS